jgi:hypothetical protein
VDTKELEALNLLHYSPVDENGGVLGQLNMLYPAGFHFTISYLLLGRYMIIPSIS